jgi:hypothetical protein
MQNIFTPNFLEWRELRLVMNWMLLEEARHEYFNRSKKLNRCALQFKKPIKMLKTNKKR